MAIGQQSFLHSKQNSDPHTIETGTSKWQNPQQFLLDLWGGKFIHSIKKRRQLGSCCSASDLSKCVPPTSFCNKLQKTSICYGLLHTKGGTNSISLSSSAWEERDDKSKKKKTNPTSARRSCSPSRARSRDSTHTHTHPSSRGGRDFFFFFVSFFISGNVLHHPARVVSITSSSSAPNPAAASKCHTLKAN